MQTRILAVGDVVGDAGLRQLARHLRKFKKEQNIAFAVVNGENASGVGLTSQQAEEMLASGADAITLGNHTWGRIQIASFLDDSPYVLRPANFSGRAPGRGVGIYDLGGMSIRVVSLIGRCNLDWNTENPFTTMDKILAGEKTTFTVVDFHAEASSEKLAMGYHLDGRVSALWGTHTHVPTADGRVYPKGTGYQSDLGMTGPIESVLGVRPEQSVETFLGGLAGKYQVAEGPCKLQGAIFTLENESGLCSSVERIDLR